MLAHLAATAWLTTTAAHATGLAAPDTSVSAPASEGGPRVRPADNLAARALRDGMLRSPTFRALVERLERGSVVVYVSIEPRQSPRLAGTITWMADTGALRYVRIGLRPHAVPLRVIASLGHELQHAVEIDDRPGIRSVEAFVALYRSIGRAGALGGGSWDTRAAADTGAVILAELEASPEPVRPRGRFGPAEWHTWYRDTQVVRTARGPAPGPTAGTPSPKPPPGR
ncbi:MAG: hypothetical protein AB7O67_09880 [Vicinamibacterales bacterium]